MPMNILDHGNQDVAQSAMHPRSNENRFFSTVLVALFGILATGASGCSGAKDSVSAGGESSKKADAATTETLSNHPKAIDQAPPISDPNKSNSQANRTFVREDVH